MGMLFSRIRRGLGLAVACTALLATPAWAADLRWLCYYGDSAKAEELADFDLLVLEPDRHPPLDRLIEKNRRLIGYLSLGEIDRHRPYHRLVKAEGLLLEANPNWPDASFVDLRDKRWAKRVVEEIVPAILRQGFGGIFLDTLDDAAFLEARDPARFAGMRAAAVRLVKSLRQHYPHITIAVNRGFDLLPDMAGDIDIVVAESLHTTWNFADDTARRRSDEEYGRQLAALRAGLARRPDLTVLTLDYWDMSDRAGTADIYRRSRAAGFAPYVTTIGLDRVTREPRS